MVLKVRWRQLLIYGPLAILLLAFALGPYVFDLYVHPSWWNGIVFAVAIVIVTVVIWPQLWPKKKSR